MSKLTKTGKAQSKKLYQQNEKTLNVDMLTLKWIIAGSGCHTARSEGVLPYGIASAHESLPLYFRPLE
jgi:hypothetical protein